MTAAALAGGAAASGPDVTYLKTPNVHHWAPVGDVHAYSLASQTCNVGDENLLWGDVTPLLAMNAYRLHDGRLEQIGMSWVKNGTWAAAGTGCGSPCNGHGGRVLGAGCRDVYGGAYNGGFSYLGPRSAVNPLTGEYPGPSGGSGDSIYKRLQVHAADLAQADEGALYFVEGQYVAPDDAAWGNAMNNASFKRVLVEESLDLTPADDDDNVQLPAIYAWQMHGQGVDQPDPAVSIKEVDVPGEGRFHVAARVREIGGGTWRYDYAVRNHNSHRAAGRLTVSLGDGVVPAAIGFHDVDYHSGEPYDNTDWQVTTGPGVIRWSSPQTFEENEHTNALRWGTMYSFWFEADAAPVSGSLVLGLFRPGTPEEVSTVLLVPGDAPPPPPCPADLDGNQVVDVQDMVQMILGWGPCAACPEDLDGDGAVDVEDLVQLILAWGACAR